MVRPDYFDEMLERIRESAPPKSALLPESSRSLCPGSDYDKTDKATQVFFATVAKPPHFRRDPQKRLPNSSPPRANPADPHFGLLAWKGDKVTKGGHPNCQELPH